MMMIMNHGDYADAGSADGNNDHYDDKDGDGMHDHAYEGAESVMLLLLLVMMMMLMMMLMRARFICALKP